MGPPNELWSSHLLHNTHNVGPICKWKLGEFDQMNQHLLNFWSLYQSSFFNYRIASINHSYMLQNHQIGQQMS
jgi:hypothetical protein